MKTLNVGIVGAGRIGNVHAQSITYHIPQARVVRVTDVNAQAAQALAERYGIPAWGTDYMEIVRDPQVDAVLVCSPTPTHAQIAIEAMRAGKHVFCEKPVDLTLAKIRETARVAQETGMKLQVGFNRRFDHNHGRVQRLAAEGAASLLLPVIPKEELFAQVRLHGALPRKAFSMGAARDKRYYLECRRIRP